MLLHETVSQHLIENVRLGLRARKAMPKGVKLFSWLVDQEKRNGLKAMSSARVRIQPAASEACEALLTDTPYLCRLRSTEGMQTFAT